MLLYTKNGLISPVHLNKKGFVQHSVMWWLFWDMNDWCWHQHDPDEVWSTARSTELIHLLQRFYWNYFVLFWKEFTAEAVWATSHTLQLNDKTQRKMCNMCEQSHRINILIRRWIRKNDQSCSCSTFVFISAHAHQFTKTSEGVFKAVDRLKWYKMSGNEEGIKLVG